MQGGQAVLPGACLRYDHAIPSFSLDAPSNNSLALYSAFFARTVARDPGIHKSSQRIYPQKQQNERLSIITIRISPCSQCCIRKFKIRVLTAAAMDASLASPTLWCASRIPQ
uniref:Uncharacterized protein n=1 Tax=Panagrellus redivivus TaxID=6233 RepID=A0A7E4V564_PANRE